MVKGRSGEDRWESHVPPEYRRETVGALEVVSAPLWGISDLRRMAVAHTPLGTLVFSPICLKEKEMDDLFASKPVALIVVPAALHRLDSALYKQRFPEAKVICPADVKDAVSEKVPVDHTYEELFQDPQNPYGITAFPAPMKPGKGESALFLRDASCLLLCDVVQNIDTSHWSFPFSWIAKKYLIDASQGLTMSYGFRHWMSAGGSAGMKKFISTLAEEVEKRHVSSFFVCHGRPVAGTEHISHELSKLADKL